MFTLWHLTHQGHFFHFLKTRFLGETLNCVFIILFSAIFPSFGICDSTNSTGKLDRTDYTMPDTELTNVLVLQVFPVENPKRTSPDPNCEWLQRIWNKQAATCLRNMDAWRQNGTVSEASARHWSKFRLQSLICSCLWLIFWQNNWVNHIKTSAIKGKHDGFRGRYPAQYPDHNHHRLGHRLTNHESSIVSLIVERFHVTTMERRCSELWQTQLVEQEPPRPYIIINQTYKLTNACWFSCFPQYRLPTMQHNHGPNTTIISELGNANHSYTEAQIESAKIFNYVFYPCLLILGTVGNVLNLCVLWRTNCKKASATIYLTFMAMADIFVL